ncbi:hypothetical protein AruPA_04335 [Acidiphilium sp. PA]|uniref:hypothetical protein n=1 Tax=Acidiphilium sp. PA TaxID=2871705 RepID=UPI0022447F34|nr:hypothetical protein [Acidiphilium sp. PA]MCW8306256.1 hypothetical protein [Acidiphilium sp. PA]
MSAFIYLPIILLGCIIMVCCVISVLLWLETRRHARRTIVAPSRCRRFQPRVIIGGGSITAAGVRPAAQAARVTLRLVGADD